MEAGVSQLVESYTAPLETVSSTAQNNNAEMKVLNNLSLNAPVEVSTEITGTANINSISGLTTSQKKQVDQLCDLLDDTSLALDFKYDGNKQAYATVNGKVEDVEVSGEALYDGNQFGIRSKELNNKWLVADKEQLKEGLEESLEGQNVDVDEIKEYLEDYKDQLSTVKDTLNIDTDTQNEIQERYKNVLTEYVKDKSKEIESKNTKIEVNGKNKKCQKLSLELDDDDLKDLLSNYIDTFGDDTQLQGIIRSILEEMDTIEKTSNSYYSSNYAKQFDNALKSLDSLKDTLDDAVKFDGTVTLIVYGTSSETYRADIIIDIDDEKVALETTFNKNETVTNIKYEDEEMAVLKVSYDTNYVDYSLDLSEIAKKQNMGDSFIIDVRLEVNGDDSLVKVSYKLGSDYDFALTVKEDINTNTDKEYDGNLSISLDAKVKDMIDANFVINAKTRISLDTVVIPTISENEKVDATDEAAYNAYLTEMEPKISELGTKLQNIEIIKELIEEQF